MKDPEVQELLEYWHNRQENETEGVGFQFEASRPVLSKRKRARSQTRSVSPSSSRRQGQKKSNVPEKKWTKYIKPDSRRRKKRSRTMSSDSESSGEEFDFSTIDTGCLSEPDHDPDDGGWHGPLRASTVGKGKKVDGERDGKYFDHCLEKRKVLKRSPIVPQGHLTIPGVRRSTADRK